MTIPVGVNMQRLRPYLEDALLRQKDKRTARALADKLDRGQWRARTEWKVVGDEHDEVDLDSLHYRIDVLVRDGWATLARVHWSRLGLEWADVCRQWDETLRQHREGIYPDGSNDPDPRAGEWPELH